MRFRLPDDPLRNPTLVVLKELPEGVEEKWSLGGLHGLREAWGTPYDIFHTFYYCYECEGWIEGNPEPVHFNNWEPQHLAGRKGTAYECQRCGVEIVFLGVMS